MARPSTAAPASANELLHTFGRLTGQAIEGIQRQQARVELAMALQRRMLPPALPDVASLPGLPGSAGLRFAGRYAPASDGLDIGGDWYDVFPMSQGAFGFAIGDVQGHDVEAAAFMGQVRMSLRAVAGESTDPGEILGRANDLLVSMGTDRFVTCSLLCVDPVSGEVATASAGHVPTVWVTAGGGRPTTGPDARGLPLGIFAGERYPVVRRRLAGAGAGAGPGAIVLLTDGVVEGPSLPMDEGLELVARLVRSRLDAEPDELAAEVIRIADRTGHSDDAAVLVIRHDGDDGDDGPGGHDGDGGRDRDGGREGRDLRRRGRRRAGRRRSRGRGRTGRPGSTGRG